MHIYPLQQCLCYSYSHHSHRNSSAGSGGLSEGGSLERAAGGRSKPAGSTTGGPAGEANKESRVDATRIDAKDIIDKLFEDTKIESLKPDDSAESKEMLAFCLYRIVKSASCRNELQEGGHVGKMMRAVKSIYEGFGMVMCADGMKCGVVQWVKMNTLRWFGFTERMRNEE